MVGLLGPSGPPVPPRFLVSPGPSVTAVIGSVVTLECAVDGWPVPRLSWTRQGENGADDVRHTSFFGMCLSSTTAQPVL